MKFKLDENFGTRTQNLIADQGHDVDTVRGQGLEGCSDRRLFELCGSEGYCLVTLDLDFADVTHFPPAGCSGLAVLRAPRNPSLELLEHLVGQLLQAVSQMPIENRLWVVEPGRIRIYQPDTGEQ